MAGATEISRRETASFAVRFVLVLSLGCLGVAREAAAQAAPSKEYQIKAACLLNFIQFIEWPAGSFAQAEAPIVVGVLGEDPFGEVLDYTFRDESVQGRRLVIKRSRQVEELKSCQLVFVCKSEKQRLAEVLAQLGDASVVTVGEVDEFARAGGIVNFYIESAKIRFEVNAETAQRKGLKIGSQLLKRARIVGSDPRKGRE
jgi:hypothetical protein